MIDDLCPPGGASPKRDAVVQRMIDREARYAASIDACWAMADVTDATIVLGRDEAARTIDGCEAHSVIGESSFEIKTGDNKKLTLSVFWMGSVNGRIYLDREPRCALGWRAW